MTLRRTTVIALVTSAALAAGGCGGGGGGGETSTSTGAAVDAAPARAAYVARANAICRVANARVTGAAKQVFTGGTPTLPQIRRYARTSFLPVVERELRDLRALTPPAGDDGAATAIYDAIEAGLVKARANPVLLGLPGRRNPFTAANARARRYGLTVCAS